MKSQWMFELNMTGCLPSRARNATGVRARALLDLQRLFSARKTRSNRKGGRREIVRHPQVGSPSSPSICSSFPFSYRERTHAQTMLDGVKLPTGVTDLDSGLSAIEKGGRGRKRRRRR